MDDVWIRVIRHAAEACTHTTHRRASRARQSLRTSPSPVALASRSRVAPLERRVESRDSSIHPSRAPVGTPTRTKTTRRLPHESLLYEPYVRIQTHRTYTDAPRTPYITHHAPITVHTHTRGSPTVLQIVLQVVHYKYRVRSVHRSSPDVRRPTTDDRRPFRARRRARDDDESATRVSFVRTRARLDGRAQRRSFVHSRVDR